MHMFHCGKKNDLFKMCPTTITALFHEVKASFAASAALPLKQAALFECEGPLSLRTYELVYTN